jgi:hypothetical protein
LRDLSAAGLSPPFEACELGPSGVNAEASMGVTERRQRSDEAVVRWGLLVMYHAIRSTHAPLP